jgi:hypothetical protein
VTPEGFLFDMGGHVIFSHYQYFDELLDTGERPALFSAGKSCATWWKQGKSGLLFVAGCVRVAGC